MADLVEELSIHPMLLEAGVAYQPGENFENVYQAVLGNPETSEVARSIEDRVRKYFAGLVLPGTATVYDKLILSLRGKDYIATFNWDPLLAQAYKRNRHVGELPQLLFLHGNVDVGACREHRNKGFLEHSCPECQLRLEPVPLLYPVSNKGYDNDPFIHSEWLELRSALRGAYILTIFGYAAPISDEAAKSIMLEAWQANQSRELAEIDIVDIKDRKELEQTWAPFFVRSHYGISTSLSWLFRYPRRSCDHFAMATLQQQPCPDNPLPETLDLPTLQAWFAPLIEQERALREEGAPFPC